MAIDFERILREQTTTVRAFNADLVCLKNERIASQIASSGIYERVQTPVVPLFVRFGTHVFDVGANIGYYTTLLSAMVGIPGRVHAFEANPVTARFLQETKARNNLDNVIVNNLAASATNEPMMIAYDPNFEKERDPEKFNLGGWSLVTKKPGELKIDCVTLDDYCEQNAIPSVSFIKIDVEGFEENVLRGAKRMLRKFKPALMVEFYAKTEEAHEKNMRVLELLKSSGYEFGRILNTRYPQLRQLAETDFETRPYAFYIIALDRKDAAMIYKPAAGETGPVESTRPPPSLPGRMRQALRLVFGR